MDKHMLLYQHLIYENQYPNNIYLLYLHMFTFLPEYKVQTIEKSMVKRSPSSIVYLPNFSSLLVLLYTQSVQHCSYFNIG